MNTYWIHSETGTVPIVGRPQFPQLVVDRVSLSGTEQVQP